MQALSQLSYGPEPLPPVVSCPRPAVGTEFGVSYHIGGGTGKQIFAGFGPFQGSFSRSQPRSFTPLRSVQDDKRGAGANHNPYNAPAGGSGKRQLADGLAHSPSAKPSALPLPPRVQCLAATDSCVVGMVLCSNLVGTAAL